MPDVNVYETDIEWLQAEAKRFGLGIQPVEAEDAFADCVAERWMETGDADEAREDIFYQMFIE